MREWSYVCASTNATCLRSAYPSLSMSRDVKKIRTREYLRIKPVTSRKRILKMDTRYRRYEYFLYPHVNGAGTGIIVSVPVDTHTRETLIHKNTLIYIYIYIYILVKHSDLIFLSCTSCLRSSNFKYWYVVFLQVHPTFFSFLFLKLGIYSKPYIDNYVYGMLVVKWWNQNKNTWHVAIEVYYLFILFILQESIGESEFVDQSTN